MELADILVSQESTVKEAMEKMEKSGKKIIYIAKNSQLVGVLSDGDIRRYILTEASIYDSVEFAMNKSPIFLKKSEELKAVEMMKDKKINSIPIVDDELIIKSIKFSDENLTKKDSIDNKVVIMAGGSGTRLYPYTKILPKPLIPIGEIPIIERIINKFFDFGCDNFLISVNYKKNMIKSYFNEENRNYEYHFIEEDKPLGTGGSLFLMKKFLDETFFVTNCDILVDADYSEIMEFHKKSKNDVTFIASLKHTQIPYGVLKLDENGLFDDTVEKPEYTHLINTGMYVLEPGLLDLINEAEFMDLPNLITKAKEQGFQIGVFPVSENSWLDMGQIKEMENMIKKIEAEV